MPTCPMVPADIYIALSNVFWHGSVFGHPASSPVSPSDCVGWQDALVAQGWIERWIGPKALYDDYIGRWRLTPAGRAKMTETSPRATARA